MLRISQCVYVQANICRHTASFAAAIQDLLFVFATKRWHEGAYSIKLGKFRAEHNLMICHLFYRCMALSPRVSATFTASERIYSFWLNTQQQF